MIEACISNRAEGKRPARQEVKQMVYASIEQEGEKRNQILCEKLHRMSQMGVNGMCRREGKREMSLLVSDACLHLGLISYKYKGNKSTSLTRTIPRPLQATAVDQGAFQ